MIEPRCLIRGDGSIGSFPADFAELGKWFRQPGSQTRHEAASRDRERQRTGGGATCGRKLGCERCANLLLPFCYPTRRGGSDAGTAIEKHQINRTGTNARCRARASHADYSFADVALVADALPLARDPAAVVPFDRCSFHATPLSWADGDTAWTDTDCGVEAIIPRRSL